MSENDRYFNCPKCKGKGWITRYRSTGKVRADCPTCCGAGIMDDAIQALACLTYDEDGTPITYPTEERVAEILAGWVAA